jgi:hypothetical protein
MLCWPLVVSKVSYSSRSRYVEGRSNIPSVYNNQASNTQGNIQNMLQVGASQTDFDITKCPVFLCKGYQFADNSAGVQSFTVGQVVPIAITIGAPHTGVANVSVVDTATNTVIGSPLISFTDYASTAHTIPANNTAFSITIPDVGSQCATAGACVVQWFWDARSVDQTYESCIDFTVGGSGSGAAAPAASPTTTAVTTKVAAATSTTVAPAATVTPEMDCGDVSSTTAAPAATVTPETDCDDGAASAKERRHARDFIA